MNDIENARADIRKYFDPSHGIEGSEDFEVSPSGHFRLETKEFSQTKPDMNWIVTRVRIFDRRSEKMMFEFVTDNRHFHHAWFQKRSNELLLSSEILDGGQTIINLTGKELYSYCSTDAGFIWADYHMSPSTERLAVIGCYWACPYEIKVYDFNDPFNLPLKLLGSFPLEPGNKTQINWISDQVFECLSKTDQRKPTK